METQVMDSKWILSWVFNWSGVGAKVPTKNSILFRKGNVMKQQQQPDWKQFLNRNA